MTLRKRAVAVFAAIVVAFGGVLAAAGPAQAAPNWRGCPSDYLCLYDGTYWGPPVLYIPAHVLIEHTRDGIPLNGSTGYRFDNRTGSVVNHTFMDVDLAQFLDGSGAVWRTEGMHTYNFAGRWFNGRTSFVMRVT
jgi:hypothetical protein